MRSRRTRIDWAHALLIEWGSGYELAQGIGYPAAPVEPTVQGARAWYTAPEQYARRLRKWATLDAAARAVKRHRAGLYVQLHRCYVDGRMCSQSRLRQAQLAFLDAYEGNLSEAS